MLTPQEIALLDAWLASARGRSFDVVLAGKIFGGRPGEAPQWPEAYERVADGLALQFGGGRDVLMTERDGSRHPLRQGGTERLVVIRPAGISAGPDGSLAVARAEEARFGWHYYGRAQTEENWCEHRYRLREREVEREVTGPCREGRRQASPERFPLPEGPLVLLKPGW